MSRENLPAAIVIVEDTAHWQDMLREYCEVFAPGIPRIELSTLEETLAFFAAEGNCLNYQILLCFVDGNLYSSTNDGSHGKQIIKAILFNPHCSGTYIVGNSDRTALAGAHENLKKNPATPTDMERWGEVVRGVRSVDK